MVDWTNLVNTASAVSGVLVGVVGLVTAARTARRQKVDLERLRGEAQTKALESSDIAIVGKYLFDDIGAVRVSDAVSDDRVRARTLQAFSRLTQFIGTEPITDAAEASAAPMQEQLSTDELSEAREKILAGEVWNGLALMRRHLEITLRQAVPEIAAAKMGAGQLISAAARTEALPADAVTSLRYAVSVANSAIHGQPVEVDAALAAVEIADHGLRLLRSVEGSRSRPSTE